MPNDGIDARALTRAIHKLNDQMHQTNQLLLAINTNLVTLGKMLDENTQKRGPSNADASS